MTRYRQSLKFSSRYGSLLIPRIGIELRMSAIPSAADAGGSSPIAGRIQRCRAEAVIPCWQLRLGQLRKLMPPFSHTPDPEPCWSRV